MNIKTLGLDQKDTGTLKKVSAVIKDTRYLQDLFYSHPGSQHWQSRQISSKKGKSKKDSQCCRNEWKKITKCIILKKGQVQLADKTSTEAERKNNIV